MERCYYFFLSYSSSKVIKKVTFEFELFIFVFDGVFDRSELIGVGVLELFEPLGQGEIFESDDLIFFMYFLLIFNSIHSILEEFRDQVMMFTFQISKSLECSSVLLTALLSS